MTLVTPSIYRRYTQDYDPEGAYINDAVAVAEQMLEEVLNRKFDSTVVVNELAVAKRKNDGSYAIYPEYMPVTSISTTGWAIHQHGYLTAMPGGLSLVWNLDQYRSGGNYPTMISYTGGWTTETAPANLLMAISKLAKNVIYQNTGGDVPAGISRASMGSLSVDLETTRQSSLMTDDVMRLARGYRRIR